METHSLDLTQVVLAEQAIRMVQRTLPPYYEGMALHRHPDLSEGYYVREGTLAITVEDCTLTLSHGMAFLVPPGALHTCWNPTAQPTLLLLFYVPGDQIVHHGAPQEQIDTKDVEKIDSS